MRIASACVAVLAALGTVSSSFGAEQTSDQLPAALAAIDIDQASILSTEAASEIRGQSVNAIGQSKAFGVGNGFAVGKATLFEGVTGTFKITQYFPGEHEGDASTSVVLEGPFGGLAGTIGVGPDHQLNYNMQGKAFQELLEFSGAFAQSFSQFYGAPLLQIGY